MSSNRWLGFSHVEENLSLVAADSCFAPQKEKTMYITHLCICKLDQLNLFRIFPSLSSNADLNDDMWSWLWKNFFVKRAPLLQLSWLCVQFF